MSGRCVRSVLAGCALVVSGSLGVVYSVVFGAVTALQLVGPVGHVVVAYWQGEAPALGSALVSGASVYVAQLVCFAVVGLMGALTVVGGGRLVQRRSPGVVWLAVLCSTAVPLLGVLIHSSLTLGIYGVHWRVLCHPANVPMVSLLLVGGLASTGGTLQLRANARREILVPAP